MSGAGEWLLAVLSACILCAVAESLMPAGPVKRVGKLVCGLVLLCALLSGVGGLDLEGSRIWAQQWRSGLEADKENLNEQVNEGMKVIIEEKCEAYIVDKAAQMGLTCTAQVSCRMEGELWVPEEVKIQGALSTEDRERLGSCIQEDLGIPSHRQIYEGGEGES